MRHYLRDEITAANRKVKRIISMRDMEFEIPLEQTHPVFVKENGEYHGTDTMRYPSKVINYELGIHFNFHALRHPYVKPTTKKFITFFEVFRAAS